MRGQTPKQIRAVRGSDPAHIPPHVPQTTESLQTASREAEILAALASEHRLHVIELLREGERCVCEVTPAFNLDPSVVSRHLTLLEHSGVITSHRDGRRIYYQITDRRVLRLADTARQMAEHPEQARPVMSKNKARRRAC